MSLDLILDGFIFYVGRNLDCLHGTSSKQLEELVRLPRGSTHQLLQGHFGRPKVSFYGSLRSPGERGDREAALKRMSADKELASLSALVPRVTGKRKGASSSIATRLGTSLRASSVAFEARSAFWD